MQTLTNLPLRDAKPSDRPHLLLWDTPNEFELQQLAFYNNAQRFNYRKNLLSRIEPKSNFLVLHRRLDRELSAIKSMCANSQKPVLIIEGLDCLVTYLYVQSDSPINLFWQKIIDLRQLENILWILMPSKLAPQNWPETRIKHITTN